MRLVVLLCLALVLAPTALVALAPAASACTGDPSVCGVKRSAECTLREGVEAAPECWWWI